MESYRLDLDKLKMLAFQQGMSMAKLCESAGMGRSRASEWKKRGVNPHTVFRLAQVLDVEPTDLIYTGGISCRGSEQQGQ